MSHPLSSHIIYETVHGSQAYGLATPESDVDSKGVYIAPREQYLGYLGKSEQFEEKLPHDRVVYELTKFLRLAAECNPNIIEVLFTEPGDILTVTPAGERLRENARLFLSTKAKFTFSGYAHAQLKRIEGHYRWLKNPPKAPPSREEFGLPDNTLVPKDHLLAGEAAIQKTIDSWDLDWEPYGEAEKIQLQAKIAELYSIILHYSTHENMDEMMQTAAGRFLGYSENFIEILQREKRFTNAQREWEQYNSWKTNRNPKRAALEEKYGYDTKHASHLVRLMRMGEEILTTGKVIVKRPDRDELLAIKTQGIWSYEYLVEWARKKDEELDKIYKSGISPLPRKPDEGKIQELCISLVEEKIQGDT